MMDEIVRLRRQNHEYAERRDHEMAALQSKVDRYRNAYERARELVRGTPADWSKDAAAAKEDGWWNYTSQQNRDIIAAAVLAAQEARDAPDAAAEKTADTQASLVSEATP